MPNQCHSGIHGVPWHRCDVCGWDWPTSKLVRQPGLRRGILACPNCLDNPLTFYRDIIIQDNLTQSADDEASVAPILKEPSADDSPVY
jgi:hypothetical protein